MYSKNHSELTAPMPVQPAHYRQPVSRPRIAPEVLDSLLKRIEVDPKRKWLRCLIGPLVNDYRDFLALSNQIATADDYKKHLDDTWFAVILIVDSFPLRWPVNPTDEYSGRVGSWNVVHTYVDGKVVQEAGMLRDIFSPWHDEVRGIRADQVWFDEGQEISDRIRLEWNSEEHRRIMQRIIDNPPRMPQYRDPSNHPMRTPQPVGFEEVNLDAIGRDLERFQSDLARQEMYGRYINSIDAQVSSGLFVPRHPGELDADFRRRLLAAENAARMGVPVTTRSASDMRTYLSVRGVDVSTYDDNEVAIIYARYVETERRRG